VPYHVRITSKDLQRRSHDALALDKDERWIEEHIATCRRQGSDIFVDGQVFTWDSIDKIRITWTDETSEQLLPQIRTRRRSGDIGAIPVPDEWYVARNGRDVTEQFLTGPPGPSPRAEVGQTRGLATNRKAVMVIYGHDLEARDALFDWLRAIGLQPREWNQLVNLSGAASPYIGQVLDAAFHEAQAVVALFTPDERVIATSASTADHGAWRLQARPNVLIEAGMALSTHPDRTILTILGRQDLPTDLAGRNYIRLSPTSPEPLHDLARRLHQAGCETDTTGTDWLKAGRFPYRDHTPQAPPDTARSLLTSPGGHIPSPAKPGDRIAPYPTRLTRTLIGHEDLVRGVAFSPDGTLLATTSYDCTVRLWDLATGQPARTLTGHEDVVRGVAFSPDGTLLATACYDCTVRLWDLATGQTTRALTGHDRAVRGVAFSPDGTLLATASDDRTARLWDLATGQTTRTLTGHESTVDALAFSPDGALLATASYDCTARLWDLATGQPARSLTGHEGDVNEVAFSPDGTLLATASDDRTARLWDLATGQTTRTLTGHEDAVRGVAFSPDGAMLATTSNDKTTRQWDLATSKCIRVHIGHTNAVVGVAFSPDGTMLATTSSDCTVRLWS
jgi:WD40 repeat protein